MLNENVVKVLKNNTWTVATCAAGVPNAVPVGFKDVSELKALCERSSKPVILKGIMSVKGARKAMQAGAAGIIVSNHGGRVLDGAQSGIEVLEDIVAAVGKTMKVFVDGGFRSGNDVFKALALGADGVLIGRPISPASTFPAGWRRSTGEERMLRSTLAGKPVVYELIRKKSGCGSRMSRQALTSG